jgi:hypothetical protein
MQYSVLRRCHKNPSCGKFDNLDWAFPFYPYEGNTGISDIISDTNQNRNDEQNRVSHGYK